MLLLLPRPDGPLSWTGIRPEPAASDEGPAYAHGRSPRPATARDFDLTVKAVPRFEQVQQPLVLLPGYAGRREHDI